MMPSLRSPFRCYRYEISNEAAACGAGPRPSPSGAAGAPQEALRQRLPLPQGVTTVQGPHPEGRELHLEFVGRSLQSDFFHSVHQSVLSLVDAVLFLRARRCWSYSQLANLTSCWQNTVFLPTVNLGSFIETSILSVVLIIYPWGYFHMPGSIASSKDLACPVWLINRFNSQKLIIDKIKQFCVPSFLLLSRSF